MRKYMIDNIEFNPIRMGEPEDFDYGCEQNATCHDCGCSVGEIHHLNCDAQRCPACGLQFISCDCNIFVYNQDTNTKQFFDKSVYYKVLGNVEKLIETQEVKKKLSLENMKQKENIMEKQNDFKKVKAPIIGANGNVFNLIGICSKELKKAGFNNEAKKMTNRVTSCGSYDEALAIMQEYVIPTTANNHDEEM